MIAHSSTSLVGVIGGTKFDTQMGVKFLKERNIPIVSFSIAPSPQEQTLLQLSKKALTARVQYAIDYLGSKGCKHIFIYCNSLSGAIDLGYLRKCFDLFILTPLETYMLIANRYKKIGLLAANCQSLGNIEMKFLRKNPELIVTGFSSLLIVKAVEEGLVPEKIIDQYSLVAMCKCLQNHDIEVLVLGCTHFSYFYQELSLALKKANVEIPIFDPSEMMYECLLKNLTCNQ